MSPALKFSDTAIRRQRCDRNTLRNNLRFLQGTATFATAIKKWYQVIKVLLMTNQGIQETSKLKKKLAIFIWLPI